MKGISTVVALVAVILFSLLGIEAIIVTNFIADIDVMKRTARETTVIEAINTMEIVKFGLKQAIHFTFYEASYTILKLGGFCNHTSLTSCVEECKISGWAPSLKCIPWWRVYEKTYAPSSKEFVEYLSNRTSQIYQEYAKSISKISGVFIPSYCPQPPGNVTLELTGLARINITTTEKDGKIELQGKFFDIKDNANFSDKLRINTMEIYKIGKERFVENDGIKNAFIEADKKMPNSCSNMERIGCNKKPINPECVEKDPNAKKCLYKNKDTCKEMFFGNMCEQDFNQLNCEAELEKYCCKDEDKCDVRGATGPDGKLDPNERYNCTVLEEIRKLEEKKEDIEIKINIGCLKIDHSFVKKNGEKIKCNWLSESEECCSMVIDEKCCGCCNYCTPGEGCGIPDYATCTAPACPNSNCGYWSCRWKVWYECPCGYDDSGKCLCEEIEHKKCDCSWKTRSNVCGISGCEETCVLIKNVECKSEGGYTYFGSMNATIDVYDPKNIYPIYGEWKNLHLYFRVASGTKELCEWKTDDECKIL